jgi:hypothetical protein
MTEAGAALRTILEYDAGFATDPDRLERAMGDLLPHDERAGRLVAAAAAVGVPGLLAAGHAVEARQALYDRAGLRPDLAEWAVDVWTEATGGGPRHRSAAASPEPPATVRAAPQEPVIVVTEQPGAPTSLRLAVQPDRKLLAAVVTGDGVFAAALEEHGPPAWRRIATPSAPSSRDAALAWHDDRTIITWTDSTGVTSRVLTVEPDGSLALQGPHQVITGAPARYPLATIATGGDLLDILWTGDRSGLRRTVLRAWSTRPEETPLPPPDDGERFTGLDAVADGEQYLWLVATTDRDRILLTRWDRRLDDVARWTPVTAPAGVTCATALMLRGDCILVAAGPGGELLTTTAAAARQQRPGWTGIRHEHQRRKRLLAGASRDGAGWLGVVDERETWLARLGRRGDEILLGPPRSLPLG